MEPRFNFYLAVKGCYTYPPVELLINNINEIIISRAGNFRLIISRSFFMMVYYDINFSKKAMARVKKTIDLFRETNSSSPLAVGFLFKPAGQKFLPKNKKAN
jgi:hypothetical protein